MCNVPSDPIYRLFAFVFFRYFIFNDHIHHFYTADKTAAAAPLFLPPSVVSIPTLVSSTIVLWQLLIESLLPSAGIAVCEMPSHNTRTPILEKLNGIQSFSPVLFLR